MQQVAERTAKKLGAAEFSWARGDLNPHEPKLTGT